MFEPTQMFELKEFGNVLLLSMTEKRLDASMSNAFKLKLFELVNNGQHLVLLDLADVDFIDSSGLGVLVSCLKKFASVNGKLVLCGLQPAVVSMFKLTRMDRVFPIYPDADSALAVF